MVIEYAGSCTVERIAEFKQELGAALERGGGVELRFSQIVDLDLTFFQLLHAGVAQAGRVGVKLTLAADLPEQFAPRAKRCGWEQLVVEGVPRER